MTEIDIQALMEEIQGGGRVLSRMAPRTPECEAHGPPSAVNDWDAQSEALRAASVRIGQMPPKPPTLRGTLGAALVGVVRRSLWWFSAQLAGFHSRVIAALDRQSALARQNKDAVESLRRKLEETSAELACGLAGEERARAALAEALQTEIAEWKDLSISIDSCRRENRKLRARHKRMKRNLREMRLVMATQRTRQPGAWEAPAGEREKGFPLPEKRRWHFGICGTFDVSNYGDLLFPFIAEYELKRRFGDVTLHRFSYHARTQPTWPYDVTSVTELSRVIHHLDGLLIGGGFLIRFDKNVAPGYGPPSSEIHHPTGYWLSPALVSLQHNIPVAWNAPGMHSNGVPVWAKPLVELVLAQSAHVAVRDRESQTTLQQLTTEPVMLVPDTAFGLDRLIGFRGAPSAEFLRLAEQYKLRAPYIVFQPNLGFEGLMDTIRRRPDQFARFQFLVLPVSPEFGEHPRTIEVDLPNVVRFDEWPAPLVIAELIGRSEAAVGHSFHFAVTALSAGVPVFRRVGLSEGKFTTLAQFDTVFMLPSDGAVDADWLIARIGRKSPSAAVFETLPKLDDHWDRIAGAFRSRRRRSAPALDRFWQSLPGLLDDPCEGEQPLQREMPHDRHAAENGRINSHG